MSESKIILLVEDDENLLNSNRLLLESEGYLVLSAETLREARGQLEKITPDVVVLDIILPDGNGLAFLAELRGPNSGFSLLSSQLSRVPVLLLTALDTNDDIMKGLDAGGDDYLPKPFDTGVFLTRIRAMLRRAAHIPETLQKGALTLNVMSGQAYLGGEDMLLTRKEFALLLLLAQNEGKVFTAEKLYEDVWKQPMAGDDHPIKNTVYRLRKKLEAGNSGFEITAARGEGYCLEKI